MGILSLLLQFNTVKFGGLTPVVSFLWRWYGSCSALPHPLSSSRKAGYTDEPQFFIAKLAQGVAMIAAAFYLEEVILRTARFSFGRTPTISMSPSRLSFTPPCAGRPWPWPLLGLTAPPLKRVDGSRGRLQKRNPSLNEMPAVDGLRDGAGGLGER
jgi:phosphoenolpyruvate synthase/pyruvate phosphate dikinase